MNLFAELTASIRSSPAYLPPCPLCSFLEIDGLQDILATPSLHRRTTGQFGLIRCCQLSDGCPRCDTEAKVAAWWREKRQQPVSDIAIDNRRCNTLAKLSRANLEAL